MLYRPEVFDMRCRLVFYNGGSNEEEQRFLAVPDDNQSMKTVLRGIMKNRVPTVANRGRLLGIRGGMTAPLWADEAKKAGLAEDGGYFHDLIQYCVWEPDKIHVPDREIAYWPIEVSGDVGP